MTAEDRPSVGGLEGKDCFDVALSADRTSLRASETRRLRTAAGYLFVEAFCSAGFAVPGIVAKLLVAEEELLAGTEDEFVVAVRTG